MTTTQHTILNALRRVTTIGQLGICTQTAPALSTEEQALLKWVMTQWSKHSGDLHYPVPHPEHTPTAGFDSASSNGLMWDGEYGELCRELLQFCIEYFECEQPGVILDVLRQLRDDPPTASVTAACGICSNFVTQVPTNLRAYASDALLTLGMMWPKYSGNLCYFIPSSGDGDSPSDTYKSTSNKWVGEYGDLRMEFINWAIAKLEADPLCIIGVRRLNYPTYEKLCARRWDILVPHTAVSEIQWLIDVLQRNETLTYRDAIVAIGASELLRNLLQEHATAMFYPRTCPEEYVGTYGDTAADFRHRFVIDWLKTLLCGHVVQ